MATLTRSPLVERTFRGGEPARSWTQGTPLSLFNLNKKPFHQDDWPMAPLPRATPAQTWVWGKPEIYTNPIPAHQLVWPVPEGRSPLAIDSFGRNLALLGVVSPIRPTTQYDWTVPYRPGLPALTWTSQDPNLYKNPFPESQIDWPPGRAFKDPALGWIQETNLALLSAQPFVQTDWPLAPRSVSSGLDYLWGNPDLYTNPIPFVQSDWPTPEGFGTPAQDWILPVPTIILTPPPLPMIFNPDWPVPKMQEFIASLQTSLPSRTAFIPGVSLPIFRYNQLQTNPWHIQLPFTIGHPERGTLLWEGMIPMIQCAYVGYAQQGDAVEVQNKYGKLVARLSGRADLSSVRTGRISWVEGIRIPVLLENGGTNIPSGRLLIYFR